MNAKLKKSINTFCLIGLALLAIAGIGSTILLFGIMYPIPTILGCIITALAIGWAATEESAKTIDRRINRL